VPEEKLLLLPLFVAELPDEEEDPPPDEVDPEEELPLE
jgi:hypothetical protein